MTSKYCVDCKWQELDTTQINYSDSLKLSFCMHEKSCRGVDLVSGLSKGYSYCTVARDMEFMCGKNGNWFEDKESKIEAEIMKDSLKEEKKSWFKLIFGGK